MIRNTEKVKENLNKKGIREVRFRLLDVHKEMG